MSEGLEAQCVPSAGVMPSQALNKRAPVRPGALKSPCPLQVMCEWQVVARVSVRQSWNANPTPAIAYELYNSRQAA